MTERDVPGLSLEGLDRFIVNLGRNALEEIQLRKFQLMLGQVLPSNSFYRRKLSQLDFPPDRVGDLDQFRRLPFTTKQELSEDQTAHHPYGTNLTFPRDRYTRIHQTSGTKGQPLRCLDTPESWNWWTRCWTSVYEAAGVTRRDRVFFAFSFGPFIGFWSGYEAAQRIGALAFPGGGMTSHQRAKAIVENDISVLVCTPTYALHLTEVAQSEEIDIESSNVRITIHAGEPGAGLPSTKARIEKAWGARCYDHAGATEVGAWGFECQEQAGLHLNEGEFIFEVIDPQTGDQAQEGELVITNLGRFGMPVIRYRTGDRVRLADGRCPCGRGFRRLEGGVIGRIDDALIVRGVNVFPTAIEDVVRRFPETGEFALDVYRRGELDELEIRLEVVAGEPEAVAAAVEKEIRLGLGLRVRVASVPFGSLPRFDLKARRVTDHRGSQTDSADTG
jgi:phenylacetate-CoA ligase